MREITNDNSVSYVNKDDHSHRDQTSPISNTRKQKKLPEKMGNFMKKNRRGVPNYRMKKELPLLFEKHTDTLMQETKTISEETLEFKPNKPLESFSFNPPIVLCEVCKWL